MRVLISGYYGYGNVGDEALLAGLSEALTARGAEVCVLSSDPQATRALHGVASAHRYRGLASALLRSDAVVSGGGGLLQDVTSRRSLRYYLAVVRLARVLGKRTCVYGQSVGPLSPAGRKRVAAALQGVPVAVRDAPSRALLGELGVEATLVADPALLLPCPGHVAGSAQGSSASSPAGAVSREPAVPAPVLLIPRSGHDDLNDALSDAGRRLLARGQPVAVLGLHQREDAGAVAAVAGALSVEPWQASTPAEAMRRVAASRYVLSVRLHGLVFAAVCGLGFAGLAYDPKVSGFLREAGAPVFERPVDAAALAETALARTPPDADALRRLAQRAREGLAWLESRLSREHTRG